MLFLPKIQSERDWEDVAKALRSYYDQRRVVLEQWYHERWGEMWDEFWGV